MHSRHHVNKLSPATIHHDVGPNIAKRAGSALVSRRPASLWCRGQSAGSALVSRRPASLWCSVQRWLRSCELQACLPVVQWSER